MKTLFVTILILASFVGHSQFSQYNVVTALKKDTAIHLVLSKSGLSISSPWAWSVTVSGISSQDTVKAWMQVADTVSNTLTTNTYWNTYPGTDTVTISSNGTYMWDDFCLPEKFIRLYIDLGVKDTINITRSFFNLKAK
jgi:hypothetical protein